MNLGFEFVAAKSKKTPVEDEQSRSEPMRPLKAVRRNPSTDQKRVRRQMARKTAADDTAPDASTSGTRSHATEGPYKVQVAGNGENVWSENAIRHQTPEEAKAYADNLLSRWMGADMARVVPAETPNREPVDPNDPQITHNYRTGSRHTAGLSFRELQNDEAALRQHLANEHGARPSGSFNEAIGIHQHSLHGPHMTPSHTHDDPRTEASRHTAAAGWCQCGHPQREHQDGSGPCQHTGVGGDKCPCQGYQEAAEVPLESTSKLRFTEVIRRQAADAPIRNSQGDEDTATCSCGFSTSDPRAWQEHIFAGPDTNRFREGHERVSSRRIAAGTGHGYPFDQDFSGDGMRDGWFPEETLAGPHTVAEHESADPNWNGRPCDKCVAKPMASKTAARSCDSCGGDEHVTADRTLGKDLCSGCKRALQGRRRKSTEGAKTALDTSPLAGQRVKPCPTCKGRGRISQGEPGIDLGPGAPEFFDCPTCNGLGVKRAVNESAEGADRYQRTPSPRTPDWVNDQYEDDSGTDGGGANDSDSPVKDWDDRGDALKNMEERRRAIIDADEGRLTPGWDEKVTAESSRQPTEADLLAAMARTRDLGEQQRLAAMLAQTRQARLNAVTAQREVDLTDTLIEPHLAAIPFAHSIHTTATDWLDEIEVSPDTAAAEQNARAEAALWVGRTHEAVLADTEEYHIQAVGKAQAFASPYGVNAPQVVRAYMDAADRARHQRMGATFPGDPEWRDRFLNERYEVPEEAKDPQRPGATTEKGAGEGSDDPAFRDGGWGDQSGSHKVDPAMPGAGKRSSRTAAGIPPAGQTSGGVCPNCGSTDVSSGGTNGIAHCGDCGWAGPDAEAQAPAQQPVTGRRARLDRVTADMWGDEALPPMDESAYAPGATDLDVDYLPPEEEFDLGGQDPAAQVEPEFGLPDAGMAFARLEASLGSQVPMRARPFVAALSACGSLDATVAGVPARDIARNAAALTEGWGGAQGEAIRTALRFLADSDFIDRGRSSSGIGSEHQGTCDKCGAKGAVYKGRGYDGDVEYLCGKHFNLSDYKASRKTADGKPPWLNKDDDKDKDSDDDSDSDSDKDDDDSDSSKSDSDSKDDDDKSDSKKDDDSDDDDDDDDDSDDDDDDKKKPAFLTESAILGSPVTAQFRQRVQASVARLNG